MPHVTILLYENALASSISLPVEMLTAGDQMARAIRTGRDRLRIDIAAGGDAVNTFGFLKLIPNRHYESIEQTDLIILPAIWRSPAPILRRHSALVPWLQKHESQGTIICAVGSASNLLAEAGLLTNKAATTHWFDFEHFASAYPEVKLQRHHLITQAGNLYCVGSVNSVADLMVHFVQRFFGDAPARQVERHFSPEIRQSYERHLYNQDQTLVHHDEDVVRAQTFMQTQFDKAIDMASVATEVGMSVRTLTRRFRDATGISPGQYLQRVRMQMAEELLKNSNLSLAEVAESVGYSDYSHFSALFRKWGGTTPKAYRQAVRGKLFAARLEPAMAKPR